MATKLDVRQSVYRSALSMVGSAAGDTLDTILAKIDPELSKLFEDRNTLLTDGGTITWTGTQIQFSEALNLALNSKVAGGSPVVISLGASSQTLANGDMWYAVLNRTGGTATTSVAATLPAVTSANQEVFLIAKRVDAGDGTQRVYFRNGMAMNAGQSVRLGAAGGSGSGSGTGDDLDALQFRASFSDTFTENASNANSAVNGTSAFTNAVYNAAKSMYAISYDAGKTITTVGTAATLSATPAFTVAAGDVVVLRSTGEVKKITVVTTQTSYTLESAFASNQTAAGVTVSQAIHSKDVYNLAVDGASLAAAFGSATFSEILVDYKDNATSNSNLFTPNVAPVVAFTASPDNSAWTILQNRATLETDTIGSTILSSAGTSLYLRFFANKSSGSGTVNLINYKAFLQKSVASAAAGVLNSAYAFTNSVGTPYNATVSTVGGKTVLTLSFQYAVGVNPGAPYGSIDVYLNGQLIPRFINSTLTPDASYLETSGSIITLDADYSSSNLSVEVLQRAQIVDNSSANSTNIAALQESQDQGFQPFVNTQASLITATSAVGAPAAGKFYSSIINRAAMTDISQDLKAKMGVERVMTQQLYEIQNEFGPSGDRVFGIINDTFGQVRLVGNWIQAPNPQFGNRPRSDNSITDYIEITFYGTGLNLLALTDGAGSSIDFRASVDGGSEGANIIASNNSTSIIANRNYATNQIVPVSSGLTLGVHTVKIRNNNASSSFLNFYGFEVLNESSSVKVNPGISYSKGQKYTLSALSSFAYAAPVTGTRGGRVLVYQQSDGTIGQAFQAVNVAQANLTSADHTNEEVARTYYWREFGAARADDLSTMPTSSSSRAFTLDDGTTTLFANSSQSVTQAAGETLQVNSGGGFITLTFIGTGLDIVRYDGTALSQGTAATVAVNGSSIGSLSVVGALIPTVTKIVSGLPYGTHNIKIVGGSTNYNNNFLKFIVYQPKKPTLPAGAVELADYNVMATYVAGTVAGYDTQGTGLLRKVNSREITYVGAGWTIGTPGGDPGISAGVATSTSTSGNYAEYTFFGTGFEYRARATATRSNSNSITLNGLAATIANFATLTSSVYGGFAFSAGTLNMAASTQDGAGLSITGLPLGKYTVRFTNNTSNLFVMDCLDIITPIHSYKSNLPSDSQNTLPVGSLSISDNRKITPVKEQQSVNKVRAIAKGFTSSPTTTSSSMVPLQDMSLAVTSKGAWFRIGYVMNTFNSGSANSVKTALFVDGLQVGPTTFGQNAGTNIEQSNIDSSLYYLGPGVHKVDVYWSVAAGTGNADTTARTLTAEEL